MNRFSLLLFGGLLLTFGSLHAQEFSYGFKAGLNFSSFSGPLEKDATGMEVEELEFESGFQVAALFNIHLNEYFGIRPEFMYSQKEDGIATMVPRTSSSWLIRARRSSLRATRRSP